MPATTATRTVFTVPSKDLLRALNATKIAAARRPSVPCLAGTLIRASRDGALHLSQFDYDTLVDVELDAHISDETTLLIHHGALLTALNALRSIVTPKKADATDVSLTLEEEGPALTFAGYSIPLEDMPVEDYPTLPQAPEIIARFATADYTTALARVAAAAGTDDTLPVLTGANLHITEDGLSRLETTDRYRMAVAPLSPQGLMVPGDYNLPVKPLVAVAKHWSGTGTVEVLSDDQDEYGLAGVRAEGITLITRRLDKHIASSVIDTVLSKDIAGAATVDRKLLATDIKAAGKLSTPGGSVDIWQHDQHGMEVAPNAVIPGRRASAPVRAVEVTGAPHHHRVAKITFLADGVNAITSDRLTVHYSTGMELVLTAEGDRPDDPMAFRYLVMCIRQR
ncbi:hypothetical protein [Nocardiopsis synnemataformans]|uniref:DNA polymerase III subunit beta family protein n=1 Tax=Nocardiopsis synnemataformans TaxID=61305 RepID=UPI003EC0ADEB